jgi:hypothetical protein
MTEDRIVFEVRKNPPNRPPAAVRANPVFRALYGIAWAAAEGIERAAGKVAGRVFGHQESPERAPEIIAEHNGKSTVLRLPMHALSTVIGRESKSMVEVSTVEATQKELDGECPKVGSTWSCIIRTARVSCDGPSLKVFTGYPSVRHRLRHTEVHVWGEEQP